jgi:hypothetical protein
MLQVTARWQARQYEGLAEIIGHHPDDAVREKLARAFSQSLHGSSTSGESSDVGGFGVFRPTKFYEAASTPNYQRQYRGRSGGTGGQTTMPDFTRSHHDHMAHVIHNMDLSDHERASVAGHFASRLGDFGSNFRQRRFFQHVIEGGPTSHPPVREPRQQRREPRPGQLTYSPGLSNYHEHEDYMGPDAAHYHAPKDPNRRIDPVFGASSLTQIQQTVSPDNVPTPEADQLPEGVMFPIISERGGQGDGTPGPATYPAPVSKKRAKWLMKAMQRYAAQCWGCDHRAHMSEPCNAEGCRHLHHPGEEGAGPGMHARTIGHVPDPGAPGYSMAPGSAPSRPAPGMGSSPDAASYSPLEYVGRPNSPQEMMDHLRERHGVGLKGEKAPASKFLIMLHDKFHDGEVADRPQGGPHQHEEPGIDPVFGRRRVRADFMTKPHQSTDDDNPPYNSEQTSPDPWSSNTDAQSPDFAAGMRDGQADAAAARRPTFADNSSQVSPYVSGYAQGYSSGHGRQPAPDFGGHSGTEPNQNPDIPRSMGGDSGQAMNSGQTATSFQVAKASLAGKHSKTCINCGAREGQPHGQDCGVSSKLEPLPEKTSARFVSVASRRDPDFAKGYRFAARWQPGDRLVAQGSPQFEAGLYAGMTDSPRSQLVWITMHASMASRHPALARRLERHRSFTATLDRAGYRLRSNGVYARSPKLPKAAGVSTDLITDGPGTSPDPMGSTPLNGPGTAPPSGGRSDPARSGGPPPYQGAQPAGQGPVVTDDEAGPSQEGPQPTGPIGQGFSGPGPGYTNDDQRPRSGTDLAPAAPSMAAANGYSNPGAYPGGNRVARLQAFQATVQGRLALMRQGQLVNGHTG